MPRVAEETNGSRALERVLTRKKKVVQEDNRYLRRPSQRLMEPGDKSASGLKIQQEPQWVEWKRKFEIL